MADPFIAEIRIFPFNFAPRNWAFCDGQILQIYQNTALFSLIGTTFGGDGRQTMGLPNIQGRAVIQPGRGPGLSQYRWGQTGGHETVTLVTATMAAHNHAAVGVAQSGNQTSPTNNAVAQGGGRSGTAYTSNPSSTGAMQALSLTGGGGAHNNMQPYLTLNFCICLVGLYPSRG